MFILFFVIDIEKSFGNGSQINGECINMNNSKSIVCDENFRNQSMKLFSVVDTFAVIVNFVLIHVQTIVEEQKLKNFTIVNYYD